MDAKGLIEGLKGNYPQSLWASDQAIKDMYRCLKKLGYDSLQMQKLYERLLMECEYFPRISNLIGVAVDVGLPLVKRVPEKAWETWEDEEGHTWARMKGERRYETKSEESERRAKTEISFEEWIRSGGYEEIREDCGGDEGKIRKRMVLLGGLKYISDERMENKGKREMVPVISDYDDSLPIEIEYVEEEGVFDGI